MQQKKKLTQSHQVLAAENQTVSIEGLTVPQSEASKHLKHSKAEDAQHLEPDVA